MKYEKFDILKKAKYSIIPNNRELYMWSAMRTMGII